LTASTPSTPPSPARPSLASGSRRSRHDLRLPYAAALLAVISPDKARDRPDQCQPRATQPVSYANDRGFYLSATPTTSPIGVVGVADRCGTGPRLSLGVEPPVKRWQVENAELAQRRNGVGLPPEIRRRGGASRAPPRVRPRLEWSSPGGADSAGSIAAPPRPRRVRVTVTGAQDGAGCCVRRDNGPYPQVRGYCCRAVGVSGS